MLSTKARLSLKLPHPRQVQRQQSGKRVFALLEKEEKYSNDTNTRRPNAIC